MNAGPEAPIGRGGRWVVYDAGTVIEQRFSIRCFPKKRVVENQMQKRVMAETRLLGTMTPNPFVPILLASFSDKHRLYAVLGAVLVTDLASGAAFCQVKSRRARQQARQQKRQQVAARASRAGCPQATR